MDTTRAAIDTETSGPQPGEGGGHVRARALLMAFADALGLPATRVMPAFGSLARMRELAALPPGDPASDPTRHPTHRRPRRGSRRHRRTRRGADDLDPTADSVKARQSLLARLDEAVTVPTAYVLPLNRSDDGTAWQSAKWTMRRGRIVLTREHRRTGLRLPLDSLSWGPAPHRLRVRSVGAPAGSARRCGGTVGHREAHRPGQFLPRTALVAQVRGDVLHVFLPPTSSWRSTWR